MKLTHLAYSVLGVTLLFSCNENDVKPPSAFHWDYNEFSHDYVSFSSFTIGDDKHLYAMGWVDSRYGIYRGVDGEWQMVSTLEITVGEGFSDFAVINGEPYVIRWSNNSPTLWKATNEDVTQVFSGQNVWNVAELNSNLVLIGDFTDNSNGSYKLARSSDGANIEPITPATGSLSSPVYFKHRTASKIYIGDGTGSTFEYDGTKLTKIDLPIYANIKAVNSDGEFYSVSSVFKENENRSIIEKWSDGKLKQVGYALPKDVTIDNIFLHGNTIVLIGWGAGNLSVAYFLNNNEWLEIPTTNNLWGPFEYRKRILASADSRTIVELIAE